VMRELLQVAAEKSAAADPARLGSWWERHHRSCEDIAERLKLDRAAMAKLALCLVPRTESFAEDVRQIAISCGLEPRVLAELLREIELHRDWTGHASETGWTLAAHTTEQPPLAGSHDTPGT
jgi:hypothetical protein